MYREINRWVHSYEFKYSDFLGNNLDLIIEDYWDGKKEIAKDSPIRLDFVNDFINENLNKIIQDNYYAGKNLANSPTNLYVQLPNAPKEEQSFYHNHTHTVGNIIGVFYLNIPEEGGEFSVWNPPILDHFQFKPEIDRVYFFPIWLMHKALPHSGDKVRVCFNWAYNGDIRPIHKLTGNKW